MLKQSSNFNENWGFRIARVDEIVPIPDAHSIAKAVIGTDTVVVSRAINAGDIVAFFPVGSCISEKYLSANNLYEAECYQKNANHTEYSRIKDSITVLSAKTDRTNDDDARLIEMSDLYRRMVGFFNAQGRVRAIKLRGQVSMGFVASVKTLETAWPELKDTRWSQYIGKSFDAINDDLVCWKWIPKVRRRAINISPEGYNMPWYRRGMRKLKQFDRLIPGIFRQHYDTAILELNADLIDPNDDITLTVKVHGTSVILANLPVRRCLGWWDKICKFFGGYVDETEYGQIYSTRRVIQNQYINPKASRANEPGNEYEVVNNDFIDFLSPGMTVYGEIVGYRPSGSCIQSPKGVDYDYGCAPGHYTFMPYRITETGQGEVKEWSVSEVNGWTDIVQEMLPRSAKRKIMPMVVVYAGRAGAMYDDLFNKVASRYTEADVDAERDAYIHSEAFDGTIPEYLESWDRFVKNKWRVAWIEAMKNDKDMLGMELHEPMCRNKKAPREGVVLRITGDPLARAWKLKTKAYMLLAQRAADSGEADPEDLA